MIKAEYKPIARVVRNDPGFLVCVGAKNISFYFTSTEEPEAQHLADMINEAIKELFISYQDKSLGHGGKSC